MQSSLSSTFTTSDTVTRRPLSSTTATVTPKRSTATTPSCGAGSRGRRRRSLLTSRSGGFFPLLLVLLVFSSLSFLPVQGQFYGGEKTPYPEPTFEGVSAAKVGSTTREMIQSYRQDVCHRYEMVRNGTITLRDALIGMELRPLMRVGPFFQYSRERGIDRNDPGLLAIMMDELARRGGFTWRNSFGVVFALPQKEQFGLSEEDDLLTDSPTNSPTNRPFQIPFNATTGEIGLATGPISNTPSPTSIVVDEDGEEEEEEEESVTFTDLLLWSLETYDISVNWWDQTLERLERGASFLQPWFDGSFILIQKIPDEVVIDDGPPKLWNWTRPFSNEVWFMTIATIIASGLVYSWIEYLSGDRQDRTLWQWISDNIYLSAINFPQNYEFAPTSAAGRIYGISMSIWALVMTATYTANLASLLVDTKMAVTVYETLIDALSKEASFCVYENTASDEYIQNKYKQAKRVPFDTELQSYQGLNNLQCDLTVAYYQNWLGYELQKAYNPDCDLQWVGRAIKNVKSGFAVNADTGYKCSSLIRDVLDLYLNELLDSGFIEDMWDQHYSKTQDINCNAKVQAGSSDDQLGEDDGSRRRLGGGGTTVGGQPTQTLRQDSHLQQRLHPDTQLHPQHGQFFNTDVTNSLGIKHEQERRQIRQYQRQQYQRERRLQQQGYTVIGGGQSQSQQSQVQQSQSQFHRLLKGGGTKGGAAGGAAAVGGEVDVDASTMTLNQMAGTFIFHAVICVIAIVVGYITRHYNRKHKRNVNEFMKRQSHQVKKSMSIWSERTFGSGGGGTTGEGGTSKPNPLWGGPAGGDRDNDDDDEDDFPDDSGHGLHYDDSKDYYRRPSKKNRNKGRGNDDNGSKSNHDDDDVKRTVRTVSFAQDDTSSSSKTSPLPPLPPPPPTKIVSNGSGGNVEVEDSVQMMKYELQETKVELKHMTSQMNAVLHLLEEIQTEQKHQRQRQSSSSQQQHNHHPPAASSSPYGFSFTPNMNNNNNNNTNDNSNPLGSPSQLRRSTKSLGTGGFFGFPPAM